MNLGAQGIFDVVKGIINFITKKEARSLGWEGGSVEKFAQGKCIGGDRFYNNEEILPVKSGRTYTECDIDTLGKNSRGAKRIVFSNDGLIFYTENHYESFEEIKGRVENLKRVLVQKESKIFAFSS